MQSLYNFSDNSIHCDIEYPAVNKEGGQIEEEIDEDPKETRMEGI